MTTVKADRQEPLLPLVVKPHPTKRFGVHYDAVPHGGCPDPDRCDCECRACLSAFVRDKASPRTAKRIALVLFLLENQKLYEGFPANSQRTAEAVKPLFYSPNTRTSDIAIGLFTVIPQVRALRMRGVR